MVYCISDIHGELEKFHSMLELIKFSEEDTLYIIGDAIDRGPDGVEVIEEIMNTSNMVMILGNHEKMCLGALGPNNQLGDYYRWAHNGGDVTYNQLVNVCSKERRNRILEFIEGLPDHLEIEVNGQKYHLVHGYPSSYTYARVWDRPEKVEKAPIEGMITIIGHTPTSYMPNRRGQIMSIWHGNGLINIDCGCGVSNIFGRLGCLRLDDMEEFYVN